MCLQTDHKDRSQNLDKSELMVMTSLVSFRQVLLNQNTSKDGANISILLEAGPTVATCKGNSSD